MCVSVCVCVCFPICFQAIMDWSNRLGVWCGDPISIESGRLFNVYCDWTSQIQIDWAAQNYTDFSHKNVQILSLLYAYYTVEPVQSLAEMIGDGRLHTTFYSVRNWSWNNKSILQIHTSYEYIAAQFKLNVFT